MHGFPQPPSDTFPVNGDSSGGCKSVIELASNYLERCRDRHGPRPLRVRELSRFLLLVFDCL